MSAPSVLLFSLVTAIFVAACGSGDSSDGGPDASLADGGGFCCPIRGHSCSNSGGGWAASVDMCPGETNDLSVKMSVDSHGCAIWIEDPANCCQCFDGGSSDAAVDSPDDASGG